MHYGSQTIQQQRRLIEVGSQEGIVTGEHGEGKGCKMGKWPCKNCGCEWRDKHGSCPTCAKVRTKKYLSALSDEKDKARKERQKEANKRNRQSIIIAKRRASAKRKLLSPPNTQRRKDWFPCSCCMAKIGYGSKITAKLLGVTPSTVNERWAKAGIKRHVPQGVTWELSRRKKRSKSNIIRIPLPMTLADRKRRRFKGIIETIRRGGSGGVSSLTGCTAMQLRRHLESGFKRGMTWDNYGTHWHVDHILPVSSFDHTDPRQVAQCWHWTNLQPLEARANILKGDSITEPQMQLLLCATH
jgi:hypothetical protein